jgi:hypothetical protein
VAEGAVHRTIEQGDVARPLRLGLVHGHVGVAQYVFGLHAAVLGQGHTHAGGDADGLVAQPERLLDDLDDPGRQLGRRRGAADLGTEDHELVPAEADHPIHWSQHGAKAIRHRPHQPITHLVAVGVVDLLEAVEVHEQHCGLAVGALGGLDVIGQPVGEQHPVGQAGEGVVQRKTNELPPDRE